MQKHLAEQVDRFIDENNINSEAALKIRALSNNLSNTIVGLPQNPTCKAQQKTVNYCTTVPPFQWHPLTTWLCFTTCFTVKGPESQRKVISRPLTGDVQNPLRTYIVQCVCQHYVHFWWCGACCRLEGDSAQVQGHDCSSQKVAERKRESKDRTAATTLTMSSARRCNKSVSAGSSGDYSAWSGAMLYSQFCMCLRVAFTPCGFLCHPTCSMLWVGRRCSVLRWPLRLILGSFTSEKSERNKQFARIPKKQIWRRRTAKKQQQTKKQAKKEKTAKPIETLGFCMSAFFKCFFLLCSPFLSYVFFCCFCCFCFFSFWTAFVVFFFQVCFFFDCLAIAFFCLLFCVFVLLCLIQIKSAGF